MALTQLKTSGIADDAVTTDKLANAINTERTANTAKVSTTINNNADNRIITGSGTANTLEGEANLSFDGTSLLTVHVPSATGEPAINFTNSDTGTGTGNGFGLGINSSESPYIWNRENTDLRIATNNTERLRILAAGGLTFNGDTAAANALDDYEEGTFSPIPSASGGVTFTYAHNVGFYTKIGNTVTFQIYLMFYASSISGGNEGNAVTIGSLPFTIKNNDRYNPAFTIGRTYNFDLDSDKRIYAFGGDNSTNIHLFVESDDTTGTPLRADQVDQSTCMTFINGTYQI